ncbi:hypothetical protein MHYP_G00018830 [Metynnis hypsauchen]
MRKKATPQTENVLPKSESGVEQPHCGRRRGRNYTVSEPLLHRSQREIQSNSSMMELHHSSSVGETSDPPLKHAGSPEPSSVSMKSDVSLHEPPKFSRGEPSRVSVKSDQSAPSDPKRVAE